MLNDEYFKDGFRPKINRSHMEQGIRDLYDITRVKVVSILRVIKKKFFFKVLKFLPNFLIFINKLIYFNKYNRTDLVALSLTDGPVPLMYSSTSIIVSVPEMSHFIGSLLIRNWSSWVIILSEFCVQFYDNFSGITFFEFSFPCKLGAKT